MSDERSSAVTEQQADEIAQQMEQWANDFSTDEDQDVFLGWARAVRALATPQPSAESVTAMSSYWPCPACGAMAWNYPDGRKTCSRCEWEEKPAPAQGASDDGPKWIKRWERKFLGGLYRAQHERDAEQARQYAELRKPLPERTVSPAERE